jgi:hypothetical protein
MTPPARPGFRAAGPADIIAGMKGFRNRRFFEGPQGGGATLVAVLLVACLLAGMAAGFTARALTGERRRASAGKPRAVSRQEMPAKPVEQETGPATPLPGHNPASSSGAAPISFEVERAMAHVTQLAAMGVREEGRPAEDTAVQYIQSQLAAIGYSPGVQQVPIAVNGRVTHNVLAVLPGA